MNRFLSIIVLAMAGAFVVGVAPAGCYSPAVGECQYRCGAERACPDDMFCNAETFCVSEPGMGCEGPLPPDASIVIDSGMPGDVGPPPGDTMIPPDDAMPTHPELLPAATDSVTTVLESSDDVRLF